MNTKPQIELMKRNSRCNYISCNWLYQGSEDDGSIRLKSPSKHLSDILVMPQHGKHIHKGWKD